ncbi:hypothetical protein RvY_16225 [Ramazzottius varieornatus]|uniref:Cysteine and tyrosine-rich protein 1 n=1 Tax=Ramazzottius varieornatus TaxID=947166 RepID=A0A1D1VXQ1_RAMVA|nr:hypothetical protein RvY_16225 [Ramazzottius varieornatus]
MDTLVPYLLTLCVGLPQIVCYYSSRTCVNGFCKTRASYGGGRDSGGGMYVGIGIACVVAAIIITVALTIFCRRSRRRRFVHNGGIQGMGGYPGGAMPYGGAPYGTAYGQPLPMPMPHAQPYAQPVQPSQDTPAKFPRMCIRKHQDDGVFKCSYRRVSCANLFLLIMN